MLYRVASKHVDHYNFRRIQMVARDRIKICNFHQFELTCIKPD